MIIDIMIMDIIFTITRIIQPSFQGRYRDSAGCGKKYRVDDLSRLYDIHRPVRDMAISLCAINLKKKVFKRKFQGNQKNAL